MGGQPARILLVEDADDVRAVFAMLLRADGFEVVATGAGREAVELARRSRFDVLLTDLGLPDIPGDAVIREVLAGAGHRPHVVVVTGFGEPYTTRAREAGADVVLIKPVPWPRLRAHLSPAPTHAAA